MAGLCVAGQTYTLEFSLEDQSNAGLWKANPTLAAGDFQISVNGAGFENVDNIPTVAPAAGRRVALVIAAAETTAAGAGGLIYIAGVDASGDQWYDISFSVRVHAATGDAALTGDAMTLAASAIASGTFAAGAITASAIAANAITSSELADNAITAAKIADAAIDAATFATGAITAGAIAADAITSSELAASAAQEIADAVWDEAKADHTTSTSFGDLATDLDSVLDDTGSTGVVLANDAITAAKIAANAITSSELADGAITAAKIATDAITAAKIAADAITSSEFATSAAQEIADEILKRGVANVEATASSGSLAEMLLACFESAIAGTVWTIYKTDHAATFSTRTVTTDASADPIIEVT